MKIKNALLAGLALVSAVAVGTASAAIDVSAATTTLSTDGVSAISAVGGALISLAAVAVTYKWAKAAFFG